MVPDDNGLAESKRIALAYGPLEGLTMGYCYQAGRLCCDICGKAGGVRKLRCPHGYCPAVACCDRDLCRDKLSAHRKTHCKTACKRGHEEHVKTQADHDAKLAAGLFLRCAAVGINDGVVKVWFKGAGGAERVRYMAKATYGVFPIGWSIAANVTEDDFKRHGDVWDEAPTA